MKSSISEGWGASSPNEGGAAVDAEKFGLNKIKLDLATDQRNFIDLVHPRQSSSCISFYRYSSSSIRILVVRRCAFRLFFCLHSTCRGSAVVASGNGVLYRLYSKKLSLFPPKWKPAVPHDGEVGVCFDGVISLRVKARPNSWIRVHF